MKYHLVPFIGVRVHTFRLKKEAIGLLLFLLSLEYLRNHFVSSVFSHPTMNG